MTRAGLAFWMFAAGAAYTGGAVAVHSNAERGNQCTVEKYRSQVAPVVAAMFWPLLVPTIGLSALVGGNVAPFVCDREFARPKP